MILESGAKAKTVKKYLGKGWIVQACGGHVQDLPSKGSKGSSKSMWDSERNVLPEPPWGWTSGAKKKITDMVKKAKSSNVEEVYIATDPDREGEFIAWRLSIIFAKFPSQKRVTFNEITETSVQKAIEEAMTSAGPDQRTIIGIADHVPVETEFARLKKVAALINGDV